ncbi:hypothetical protein V0R50_07890 [Pseudomonas sp. 148P]|uniref:Uncharacterized protein n=1 Tax=Pseudomonas ulcerans TaxID=3115852 RepID=A0ABU7HNP7_9PSED|nr:MULTISPECIES: hypothetical protein [unclassified Pseudomonas]MEE1923641.1 hypothetical protein [Pseudomonas sp. 147P]MEE1933139.1 hypothetical protein [Pseudomonas sp. 148P]
MADRFLAFRCFGKFAWPPLKSARTGQTVEGVVEIHYLLDAAKKEMVGCARWVPSKEWNPQLAFSDPLAGIPTVPDKQEDAEQKLSGAANTILTWRFDKRGVVLAFEGVQVFEQYAVSKDSNGSFQQALDLRIPVVREHFPKAGEEQYTSRVLVGQDQDALLRFDLALPLLASLDAEQFRAKRAFVAFSALYPARRATAQFPAAAQPLSLDNMVFGRQDRSTGNIDFSKLQAPSMKAVGRFGFARYPWSDNTGRFVKLDMPGYWATRESILGDLLPTLGFRTHTAKPDSFEVLLDRVNILLPAPSITFGASAEKDGPGFRIEQRFALNATPVSSGSADSSDIRVVADKSIQLRAAGMDGIWLTFAEQLHITVVLSGAVSDVWSDQHASSLQVTIGGITTYTGNKLAQSGASFDPNGKGADLLALLRAAVASMDSARFALHQLAPDQPQSILPSFSGAPPTGSAALHFGLFAGRRKGSLSAGRLALDSEAWTWSAMLANPEDTSIFNDRVQAAKQARIPLQVSWPSLHRQPTPAGCYLVHQAEGPQEVLQGIRLGLVQTDKPAGKLPVSAQLGGLELMHGNPVFVNSARIHLRLRADPGVLGTSAVLGIKVGLDLAVTRVAPVAVDVLRGDRTGRAQPLLYQEPQTTVGTGQYWLKCTEEVRGDRQWRLLATLLEDVQSSADTQKSLLIGEQPFTFQRFYSTPLDMLGSESNAIIASYDSDDRGWKFKQTSGLYHYVLPPQVIGESMDKPRRLELQDAEVEKEYQTDGFVRPIDQRWDPKTNPPYRRAVEFRLTPAAHLWVQPSDVERNYVLPEWAAGDLFSQRGELGLGCALDSLSGEFLYGLAFGVTPRLEQGTARRTRVAEIEALTGRPVPPDEGHKEERWNKLYQVMQTRPQRLELWADDPSQRMQFAPVRFSDGARFALRSTALHRPAVAALEVPFEESKKPGLPTQEVPDLSPRLHPAGLSGGALWPIESANVLRLVLAQPRASGGSIENIALSPLGGDADQTVKLNNNRVSIISETRGGFVQRQKVEVLGRIGAFWHRAKHVVVYERTVNPSAQFTPEGGLGTRTRRPVLRKVSEYIEILEPERHYPDMPTAPVHTSCFLRALRFNKRIIPVDSFWAEDIGTVGWSIPLWNRHAARQRPQVYGMPDVAFVTSAEGDGDDPLVAQGCLDPDNLYFFADTSLEQTDDTNAWGVRRGIDYTDLPPPRHTKDSATTATVPPGFARFTWRLAPAAQRTRVNAGRADKPVYVGLETLTFMRAGRQEKQPDMDSSAWKLVNELPEALSKLPGALFDGVLSKGKVVAGPLQPLSSCLADVSELPATRPSDPAALDALKARLVALGDAAKQDVIAKSGIQEHLQELADKCSKAFKSFETPVKDLDKWVPPSCAALQNNLASAITARRMAMVQELEAWRQEQIQILSKAIPKEFALRSEFESYLTAKLNTLLLPLFESATAELGKLRRGIEVTRLTVDGAIASGHDGLDRARAELDTFKKAIDQAKPWSESRAKDLEQQIGQALARTSDALQVEVGNARQRLSVELDDFAQRIGVAAIRGVDEALAGRALQQPLARFLASVASVLPDERTVADYVAKVEAALKAIGSTPERDEALKPIRGALTAIGQNLIKARQSLRTPGESDGLLSQAANKCAGQLIEARNSLVKASEDLSTDLKTAVTDIEADLFQAFESARATLSISIPAEVEHLLATFSRTEEWADYLFEQARTVLDDTEQWLVEHTQPLKVELDRVVGETLDKVKSAEEALGSNALVAQLVKGLLGLPAVVLVIDRAGPAAFDTTQEVQTRLKAAIDLVNACTDEVIRGLDSAAMLLGGLNAEVQKACQAVSSGLGGLRDQLTRAVTDTLGPLYDCLHDYQAGLFGKIDDLLKTDEQYQDLLGQLDAFDHEVRGLCNDLATTRNLVEGYGERVVDAVGRLGEGGLLAAPNNILRAMAAFGSTPDLPNLDFSRLTSPYFFGWAEDRVDMAPINAWFGRLGDDLKALGLDMQIDALGERLIPLDLTKQDIGQALQKIAGLDLRKLLPGYKLPAAAKDAIRVTHEFDKKNLRAWVQVDVDLPLPERRSLFSVGPVTLDLMNARITAVVRLEASKDSAEVAQTGTATLLTDFDAVVAGTSMVTLSQVAVRFDRNSGLKVDFDPRKIRLNPSFQFIQNTFQSIFGDEIGGLKIIKDNGIPIGVEHLFALPPMGMMFGTSGVQNIQISNAFRLLAYPDFLISNSFALARADLPFLFSVFIIGGSGWLTVDMNYRPFNNELAVVVDAAAGGSGSLGFSFCGVSGTVSISLNVALTYRKLIGRPGGGLTVSMVVVIVGVVDVLRIASAYLSVTLRLSYQDNGDIDATGSFRVSIRISRFFTVRAGGQARYRMTGGRREVNSSTNSDVRAESLEKAKKLIDGQGRA